MCIRGPRSRPPTAPSITHTEVRAPCPPPAHIRSTALALLAAAMLIPATSAASAGHTKTLHFYAKETSVTFTAADGSVRRTPPANPKPGDSFDEIDIAYVGDPHASRHPRDRQLARALRLCHEPAQMRVADRDRRVAHPHQRRRPHRAQDHRRRGTIPARHRHATGTVTSTVRAGYRRPRSPRSRSPRLGPRRRQRGSRGGARA